MLQQIWKLFIIVVKMVQAVVIVLITVKVLLFAVCIYRYAEKNETPLTKDLLNYVLIVKKTKQKNIGLW